jgi:hypothetical protein
MFLSIVHQSDPKDRKLLVVASLLLGLSYGTALLGPSWVAWLYLLRSRTPARRLALFLGSLVLPMAALGWWSVDQWADWDEIAVIWIAMLPTLGSALWCYRAAESRIPDD